MKATLVLVIATFSCALAQDKYTTKYDSVDIDKILQNDRLLNSYASCVLGEGTCTADGTELKNIIPDAISNGCAKCNEKQQMGTRKALVFLIDKKPEIYAKLEKAFDPTGQYKKKYCQIAKNEGIVVKACS